MDNEFLRRLFVACSSENTYCMSGLNLNELYERTEDTAKSMQEFCEALNKEKLDFEVADNICHVACEAIGTYELQGFINGFRLCARLSRELRWKVASMA